MKCYPCLRKGKQVGHFGPTDVCSAFRKSGLPSARYPVAHCPVATSKAKRGCEPHRPTEFVPRGGNRGMHPACDPVCSLPGPRSKRSAPVSTTTGESAGPVLLRVRIRLPVRRDLECWSINAHIHVPDRSPIRREPYYGRSACNLKRRPSRAYAPRALLTYDAKCVYQCS